MEKEAIVKRVRDNVINEIIELGLPVAWFQKNDDTSWLAFFVESRERVIPLGEAKSIGHILTLDDLRLDNLVGILESGIRKDDYSNRFDDVRGLYNHLESLSKET